MHACDSASARARQARAGKGAGLPKQACAHAPVRVACMRRGRSWVDALLVRLVGMAWACHGIVRAFASSSSGFNGPTAKNLWP